MTTLAIGGKIAPKPSSPLRRVMHQSSALSIARRRTLPGIALSPTVSARSRVRKDHCVRVSLGK